MRSSRKNLLLSSAVSLIAALNAWAQPLDSKVRASVIKIYSTTQRHSYATPWQTTAPARGTGTGFVIAGKKILTNAHVVSDTRFLEVQKDGDPKRYRAKVLFAGHDCDLAVIDVEDKEFYDKTVPFEFADVLPELNDEVTVIGYPMGGDRLSITRGIVSRLDYSLYTHSGVDQHLVLQVDAAINPGNSGGPVTFEGKVVGLAFQGMTWAENIGYAIPTPVIEHFLDDISDGKYHGYPELGVAYLNTRNTALRRDLKMKDDHSGVVVTYIDPFGSATGLLKEKDVLLAVDGNRIEEDGTIMLDGNSVLFSEMLERKQWGDSISFKLLRDGKTEQLKVPLKTPTDPFLFRNIYDEKPEYYITGGLVFSPMTSEMIGLVARGASNRITQQLLYYMDYAKIDGLYKNRKQFVILLRRLPHPVNTYADAFVLGILSEANNQRISSLSDLKKAVSSPLDGFHVFKFEGMDQSLIMKAGAADKADLEIPQRYGIPLMEHIKEDK